MSDAVAVALIGMMGAILVALIANWRQGKSTHELINSRMTELLLLAAKAARAEGVAAGEQSQRDRAAESQP